MTSMTADAICGSARNLVAHEEIRSVGFAGVEKTVGYRQ
jgi:hypothetical protein